MIGTIVNTATIVAGSLTGALLHRGISEKYKNTLYDGLGLASLAIGLNATVQNLPKSHYPVLFIVAIALGGVVGTWIDIDGWFKRMVGRPRHQPSAAEESTQADGAPYPTSGERSRGGTTLADGLSTAILLYCIGPLSMLGPVISALQGDHTFLFTNATLDLISSTIFAATYGIGMILAAPVLFCWQGMFWLVAKISSEAVSDALMSELLIIGGLLITASGLSLLKLKDCKTLNLLPALLVPVVWFVVRGLLL
ncbi:MAG: DUF554 domain-containing protein [Prevotella sp.]|nr:DUF554 domain-containing protein [Prevotella sp.]